jgi:tRNA-dihydrouridine synthase
MPLPFPKDALLLAPMATVTHRGFRELIRHYGGCDVYFTEMVNAASVFSGGAFEEYYLDLGPEPGKTVIQLVGGEERDILQAAAFIRDRYCRGGSPGPLGVDINMGCSAPQITRTGAGAAWLEKPEAAIELVRRARDVCRGMSLSVKMRLGEADDPERLLGFCLSLQGAGVDFITLHPRLRKEKYGRPPRWDRVAMLKRELSVPVVGNGNIDSFESYRAARGRSGCDGVMLGRGAARMPWIFSVLKGKSGRADYRAEIDLLDVAQRFMDLLLLHQPKEFHETRCRRFFSYFCANLVWGHHPNAAIQNLSEPERAIGVLKAYFGECPDERILSYGPR